MVQGYNDMATRQRGKLGFVPKFANQPDCVLSPPTWLFCFISSTLLTCMNLVNRNYLMNSKRNPSFLWGNEDTFSVQSFDSENLI